MDLISWVPEKPENGGQPIDDAYGNTHPAAKILDTDNLAGLSTRKKTLIGCFEKLKPTKLIVLHHRIISTQLS